MHATAATRVSTLQAGERAQVWMSYDVPDVSLGMEAFQGQFGAVRRRLPGSVADLIDGAAGRATGRKATGKRRFIPQWGLSAGGAEYCVSV